MGTGLLHFRMISTGQKKKCLKRMLEIIEMLESSQWHVQSNQELSLAYLFGLF